MSTTASGRGRIGLTGLTLVGVLLAASACSDSEPEGGSGGDPSDPPPSTTSPSPAIDVDLTATLTATSDAIEIEWSLTNDSGESVLVTNKVPDDEGRFSDSPDTAYVVPGDGPGVAGIVKQALPVGPDAVGDSYPVVGVSELADGATLSETMRVPLPLAAYGPPSPVYDNLDLDDPVTTVTFCVGVLPGRDEAWGIRQDGDVTTVNHAPATFEDQSVLCSDVASLD